MKKFAMLLLIAVMLTGCGASYSNIHSISNSLGVIVATDMVEPITISGYRNIAENATLDSRFLFAEQAIGATVRYNYNNLTDPYMIGSIPTNPKDWMAWRVRNIKSGKFNCSRIEK